MTNSQAQRDWQIDILCKIEPQPIPSSVISTLLLQCLSDISCEGIPESVTLLSVVVTDDAEMQCLNREYRNKDKTTDVLSFSQLEHSQDSISTEAPTEGSLGDIVISFETAIRQAKEYDVHIEEELSRLLIHGLLHLLGYDHEGVPKEEAEVMFTLQDRLLHTYAIKRQKTT